MRNTRETVRLLWRNAEKLGLSLLLAVFVIVLVMNLVRYLEVMALIREASVPGRPGGTKLIEPVTFAPARVGPDAAAYWQPAYSQGKWQTFLPADILERYPIPPSIMSPELRDHLQQEGPGTLFDPAVYLWTTDRTGNVVGIDCRRNFYPPHRLVHAPNFVPPKPPKPVKAAEPVVREIPPLNTWLRWPAPQQSHVASLDFTLKNVVAAPIGGKGKWMVSVVRGGKQKILTIGDSIPGTAYRITAMRTKREYQMVSGSRIPRDKHFMTVERVDGDGDPIEIGEKQIVADPAAVPTYRLVFLPRPNQVLTGRDGSRLALSFGKVSTVYKVIAKDDALYVVDLGNPNAKPVAIPALKSEDTAAWEKDWGQNDPQDPDSQPQ